MKHDSPLVLLNLYGFSGGNYAGNVYDINGISPSIMSTKGGNKEPIIIVVYET